MNHKALLTGMVLSLGVALASFAEDSERTAPFTAAELEQVYTANITKRADDILKMLDLKDETKIGRVKDSIIAQYRSLRARDEALDTMFQSLSKNAPGAETNRGAVLKILSQQLHDHFLSRLAAELTPAQVEQVKDRMTYNKVKVTYDAYCEIVPKLTDAEKAKILELLKAAREEAMDGGSADEKTAIFQKHKESINAMLNANGHEVEKAIKEWEAKQAVAKAEAEAKKAQN
ncbi:MAG: DUF3826 domain-containing protein [Verrucomicrobiota bacterium]